MKNNKEGRYVFRDDEDGHTFLVPLDDVVLFEKMMEKAYASDNFSKFEKKFGHLRCEYHMSCYSFTDPKILETKE
jgi:hypothetical protein